MTSRYKIIRCKHCRKTSAFFITTESKNGYEFDVYKCSECKKYTKTPPRPLKITVKAEISKSCVICGNQINFIKRKSNAKTCSKKCGKKLVVKRREEYNFKRRKQKLKRGK